MSVEIRAGFTATGRVKHVLDDWSAANALRQRSVCNITVRDLDQMVEQFMLDDEATAKLEALDWCERCTKWAKNMRYFKSIGVSVATPREVIDAWLIELGLEDLHLAKVIDMQEWKRAHGRLDEDEAC